MPLAARIKLVRSFMTFVVGYKSATLIIHDIEQAARRERDFIDAVTTHVYYGIVTVLVDGLSSQ